MDHGSNDASTTSPPAIITSTEGDSMISLVNVYALAHVLQGYNSEKTSNLINGFTYLLGTASEDPAII